MSEQHVIPSRRFNPQSLAPIRQVFVDHGYKAVTMGLLAEGCGLSRRALYNHFRNKEEAFRAMLRWRNREDFAAGAEASRAALARD
jgi:AcrR family transcriptional regulator